MEFKTRIDYKKLKILARKHDKSFDEIASEIGMNRVTMYNAIKSNNPKVGYIDALAEYFGLTIMDLLTRDETRWRR